MGLYFLVFLFELFVAQCIQVKKWRSPLWLNAMHSGKKWWTGEFVPPYIILLNPDYVPARSASLASLAPQKLLIFVLVSLQRTAEGTQKARVALCGAWSNSYASFVLSKLRACSTDISTYAIFSHLPQTESLFSGYYVFGLRLVSSTTQTLVASVSFRFGFVS